jgi:hypothetical protein
METHQGITTTGPEGHSGEEERHAVDKRSGVVVKFKTYGRAMRNERRREMRRRMVDVRKCRFEAIRTKAGALESVKVIE